MSIEMFVRIRDLEAKVRELERQMAELGEQPPVAEACTDIEPKRRGRPPKENHAIAGTAP